MTPPIVGSTLLNNRNALTDGPYVGSGESQKWEAFGDGYTYLVKTRVYEGERPRLPNRGTSARRRMWTATTARRAAGGRRPRSASPAPRVSWRPMI